MSTCSTFWTDANLKTVGNVLKRVLLWDYPRASWQYDLIVAAILLFIFGVPRAWFHDQPRIPQSHEVALLPSANGASVFWLEPELLADVAENAPDRARVAKVAGILKVKTGREQKVTRVDPVYNSDHELTGYMAVAKP